MGRCPYFLSTIMLSRTSHFKRDYKKLPPHIEKQCDRKLKLLEENISHPSLRVKRVRKYNGVFEASITMDYRLFFQVTSGTYTLLCAGTHDILEKR